MYARVSTFEGSPGAIDQEASTVEARVLPAARELEGFRGLIALADRGTGRAIGITLWESRQAMEASEEAADRLRQDTAGASDQRIAGVERYEVTVFALEP
jgi:heme-degrading monooxygenase HmoA